MSLSKLVYRIDSVIPLVRIVHTSSFNFNPEAASSSKPVGAPTKGPALVTGLKIYLKELEY